MLVPVPDLQEGDNLWNNPFLLQAVEIAANARLCQCHCCDRCNSLPLLLQYNAIIIAIIDNLTSKSILLYNYHLIVFHCGVKHCYCELLL
jgi:hypothetical protein